MTTLCETEWGDYGQAESYESCGKPTDQLVTVGCVHEHLLTQPTCTTCIERIPTMWCDDCETSSQPHRCPILLIARETLAA